MIVQGFKKTTPLISQLVATLLILLVKAYQVVLSPLLGNCCRFEPSCSNYGIEALRQHGALRGSWLALRRIMRCRPLGPCGLDPVPPPLHHSSGNNKINHSTN